MASFSLTIPRDEEPGLFIARHSQGYTLSIRASDSSVYFALQYAHLQQMKAQIDQALIAFAIDEADAAEALEAAE